MVDCFHRLGHHAIVSGDDEDDDIGYLRTPRPHHRKGLVSGRVKEGYLPLLRRDLIGSNLLRNSSGFALGDMGVAYGIERLRLSVVNVAHDGNDWRTGLDPGLVALLTLNDRLIVKAHEVDLAVVFFRKYRRRIRVDGLVNRHHHSHRHQLADDFPGLEVHLLREVGHGYRIHDVNLLRNGA